MPSSKIYRLEDPAEWENESQKLGSAGENMPEPSETAARIPGLETEKPIEKEPTATEIKPTEEKIGLIKKLPAFVRRAPAPIPSAKDEITLKIEKIMEDGLGDAYSRLSPIAKQEFKIKGEETATAIRELLQSAHVKIKKIVRLIIAWLRILPGINKFFLEQEAKIKTDRIIELNQLLKNKRR